MTKQDEFVEKAKAQLDKWNAEIKRMQATAAEKQAEGQAHLKEQIDAAQAQKAEVEAQLHRIGKANEAAWTDMKSGFEAAWKSLEKGMEDARKRYDKS